MTGAIIIITICYYLIDYGLGWGLRQAQIYNVWKFNSSEQNNSSCDLEIDLYAPSNHASR